VRGIFEGAEVPGNLPLEDAQLHRDELCEAFQVNVRALITFEEAAQRCGGDALFGALIDGATDAEAADACQSATQECLNREHQDYYLRCPQPVVEGAMCSAPLQVFSDCVGARLWQDKAVLSYSCAEWIELGDGIDAVLPSVEACETSDLLPPSCRLGPIDLVRWPIDGTKFP